MKVHPPEDIKRVNQYQNQYSDMKSTETRFKTKAIYQKY